MYARSGALQKLSVAFSRDTASKVYVQQHLHAAAAEVADLLSDEKRGHLYVCGDAKRMAKDVHAAVVDILKTHLDISTAAAEDKLKQLTDQDRYQRDVW